MCGLSFKGVPDPYRNRHVCVLDREHACRLFPLILITVCFEVVKDRVWVVLHLGTWQLHIYFPYFTRPCLDYTVAGLPWRFRAFQSGNKPVFACLLVVVNNFVAIVRVTFSASVPVATVVLVHSPRFGVIAINMCALNLPLAAVPECRVVNVNFTPLGFLIKPS